MATEFHIESKIISSSNNVNAQLEAVKSCLRALSSCWKPIGVTCDKYLSSSIKTVSLRRILFSHRGSATCAQISCGWCRQNGRMHYFAISRHRAGTILNLYTRSDTSSNNFSKLQRLQNMDARVTLQLARACIYWLTVQYRINFRLMYAPLNKLDTHKPLYLCSFINFYE